MSNSIEFVWAIVTGSPQKVHQLRHGQTDGGNQARLDARTEFKILEPSPKGGWKLVVNITVQVSDPGVPVCARNTHSNFGNH